jgi:hypothetical protein
MDATTQTKETESWSSQITSSVVFHNEVRKSIFQSSNMKLHAASDFPFPQWKVHSRQKEVHSVVTAVRRLSATGSSDLFPRGGGDPRSINTLADTVAQHQHRATAQTCYESSSGSERPSPNEGTVNAAFPRHDEPSPVVLPPPPIRRLAPLPLKLPPGRVTVTVA